MSLSFVLIGIDMTSVVRASNTSFQVKWTELTYQQGSLASTENWTAILTTMIEPPKTADTLRKNPLGLYVTGISWSQDFDADSTPWKEDHVMRTIRVILTLSASALILAACAGKIPSPAISYDSGDFRPAAIEPDPPKPVQIVTVPEPLPLSGQLMPPPPARGNPNIRAPMQRVDEANSAALQEPTAYGYVNAIQVYPFTDGALYRLYAAPEQVTDIALQPGENLVSVSAGDTVRWVVGNTTSGTGSDRQVHILVKPFAPGLTTNLIIMTDRRSYHLELMSTAHTSMAAISWTYPDDQLFALQQQNSLAEATEPVAENVALADLHFRYKITGENPPWRPVRAFDDGKKVYIEFPNRIGQGESCDSPICWHLSRNLRRDGIRRGLDPVHAHQFPGWRSRFCEGAQGRGGRYSWCDSRSAATVRPSGACRLAVHRQWRGIASLRILPLRAGSGRSQPSMKRTIPPLQYRQKDITSSCCHAASVDFGPSAFQHACCEAGHL